MSKFLFQFSHDQKGMSLLSALIALGISGITVVTLSKAFKSSIMQSKRVENQQQVQEIAQVILERMSCSSSITTTAGVKCKDGQTYTLKNEKGKELFAGGKIGNTGFEVRGICVNDKSSGETGIDLQWRKLSKDGKQLAKDPLTGRKLDWKSVFETKTASASLQCTQHFSATSANCPAGYFLQKVSTLGTHVCTPLQSPDGLGKLGACSYGYALQGFNSDGTRNCVEVVKKDVICHGPDDYLKGIKKDGTPICKTMKEDNKCTLTDFSVPVSVVSEDNTKKRTWYSGSGTFNLPADAKNINMRITGMHVDDNRPSLSINGKVAFNFSGEDSDKGAKYRTGFNINISGHLKGGANVFSGRVYDRYGAYATLVPVMSGTYETQAACP